MTNADKYNLTRKQAKELCYEIARFCNGTVQAGMIMDFFCCPLQPTLTEDERVILRNIYGDGLQYEIILKRDWRIFVRGFDGRECSLEPLSSLFQFIKERRRI